MKFIILLMILFLPYIYADNHDTFIVITDGSTGDSEASAHVTIVQYPVEEIIEKETGRVKGLPEDMIKISFPEIATGSALTLIIFSALFLLIVSFNATIYDEDGRELTYKERVKYFISKPYKKAKERMKNEKENYKRGIKDTF